MNPNNILRSTRGVFCYHVFLRLFCDLQRKRSWYGKSGWTENKNSAPNCFVGWHGALKWAMHPRGKENWIIIGDKYHCTLLLFCIVVLVCFWLCNVHISKQIFKQNTQTHFFKRLESFEILEIFKSILVLTLIKNNAKKWATKTLVTKNKIPVG